MPQVVTYSHTVNVLDAQRSALICNQARPAYQNAVPSRKKLVFHRTAGNERNMMSTMVPVVILALPFLIGLAALVIRCVGTYKDSE